MADFELAIQNILKWEGKYSNDPNDQETNFGLIQEDLNKAIELKIVPHETTLKTLNIDQAKDIYMEFYWKENNLNLVNDQQLATKIFNACVNLGSNTGTLCLQRSLKAINDNIRKANV